MVYHYIRLGFFRFSLVFSAFSKIDRDYIVIVFLSGESSAAILTSEEMTYRESILFRKYKFLEFYIEFIYHIAIDLYIYTYNYISIYITYTDFSKVCIYYINMHICNI